MSSGYDKHMQAIGIQVSFHNCKLCLINTADILLSFNCSSTELLSTKAAYQIMIKTWMNISRNAS